MRVGGLRLGGRPRCVNSRRNLLVIHGRASAYKRRRSRGNRNERQARSHGVEGSSGIFQRPEEGTLNVPSSRTTGHRKMIRAAAATPPGEPRTTACRRAEASADSVGSCWNDCDRFVIDPQRQRVVVLLHATRMRRLSGRLGLTVATIEATRVVVDPVDRHAALLTLDTLVAEGTLPLRAVGCGVHQSFSGEREVGSLHHRSLDALSVAST